MDKIKIEDLNIREIGVWPKTYRAIAIIAIGIAVFILFYILVFKNTHDELNANKDKLQAGVNKFREVFQQSSNLELYSKQMNEVTEILNNLLKKLPSKSEIPLLLEDISQQAIAAGLTFDLIKPEDPIDRGFYFEQPIKMILSGNYHSFGKFAEGISGLPRIVALQDFVIKVQSKNNNQTNKDRLVIETEAKTYWYTEQEKL